MKILITFLSLAFFGSDYLLLKDCEKESEANKMEIVIISDIFEYLDETKEKLEESVNNLSEEQLTFKPEEESWSVAQIVEHIVIVEGA